MKTPDINLLIYAINKDADQHETAQSWLSESFEGPEVVGLSWIALTGFLRITTRPGVLPDPLEPDQAIAAIEDWSRARSARIIGPDDRHFQIFQSLVLRTEARGDQIPDAHLASIAIEHGATLATFDSDFHRYAELDLEYLGAS